MIFAVVFVGVLGGTFTGLLVLSNTSIGNFSFTDPRKDLARCIVVAVVLAGATAGLLAITKHPRGFVALLPIWYIIVKLCWLDFEVADLAVLGLCSLVALALSILLAVAVLR